MTINMLKTNFNHFLLFIFWGGGSLGGTRILSSWEELERSRSFIRMGIFVILHCKITKILLYIKDRLLSKSTGEDLDALGRGHGRSQFPLTPLLLIEDKDPVQYLYILLHYNKTKILRWILIRGNKHNTLLFVVLFSWSPTSRQRGIYKLRHPLRHVYL